MSVALLSNGAIRRVGRHRLHPFLSVIELAAHGVQQAVQLRYSPLLSALLIRDKRNTLHILTDDDHWYSVGSIGGGPGVQFFDVPEAAAAVVVSAYSAVVIRRKVVDGHVSFTNESLGSTVSQVPGNYVFSRHFGQFLVYSAGWFRSSWQRLSKQGPVDIQGGNIGLPAGPIALPFGDIHSLPTFGEILIEGADGLYLYDGKSIRPVKNGRKSVYGGVHAVDDMSSIGRVFIVASKGVFELSRDGTLIAHPLSLSAHDLLSWPHFADWPAAGVALISTVDHGIFAVDRDLHLSAVPGGDRPGYGPFGLAVGSVKSTGDLFLAGRFQTYLAVVARGTGTAICDHERQVLRAIPDSAICLKPVPGSDEHKIGFVYGGVAVAPDRNDLLVETSNGLFLLRPDWSSKEIKAQGGEFAHQLYPLPNAGGVLAVGEDGGIVGADLSFHPLGKKVHLLTVSRAIDGALVETGDPYRPALITRNPDGTYRVGKIDVTSIYEAVDAPWFGGVLAWTAHGTMLLRPNGGVTPFEAVSGNVPPDTGLASVYLDPKRGHYPTVWAFAVDRLQTVYVRRNPGGWYRLTRDRAWLPVHGLPDERALAHFDPGNGDFLLGFANGVYVVGANGEARRLGGFGAPDHAILAIAGTAGGNILAGGDDGLFEISRDLAHVWPVPYGSAAWIGPVLEIVHAGFAGLDVIRTTHDTFAFVGGKLSRIGALSPASSPATNRVALAVFPGLRRVVVVRRYVRGPSLSDLGRADPSGQCREKLASEP